jgi:hypothetical protein
MKRIKWLIRQTWQLICVIIAGVWSIFIISGVVMCLYGWIIGYDDCISNATTDIEITMCTGDVDPADPLADEDRWIYVD